jgi:energy-coupling factor transporter ATP-binding protein EcfA2
VIPAVGHPGASVPDADVPPPPSEPSAQLPPFGPSVPSDSRGAQSQEPQPFGSLSPRQLSDSPSSLPKAGMLPVSPEPSEPYRPAHEALGGGTRAPETPQAPPVPEAVPDAEDGIQLPASPAAEPLQVPQPPQESQLGESEPRDAEPRDPQLLESQLGESEPRQTPPRESQPPEAAVPEPSAAAAATLEEPATPEEAAATLEEAATPEEPAPPQAPAQQQEPAQQQVPAQPLAPAQAHTRVDARLLEAALLNLRKRIAAIPLVFEIPGSAEVKTERTKLLSQIDDYLLPRVRQSAAPLLVALVGSTGAGKSTLVNSIVGAHVSATGVRRPTTNSPVLACHPDDIDWFAENSFLPTLPRVRQEGLARPGRDGLLVLAASEGMPRGIALLDTPDIDSVVQAHHEFAHQFLDASDLWLFMTSASRYADGPVWEILQHARDRKASLGVVLSRIPQAYRTELVDHFTAMLDANGIGAENRFVILETPLIDGMLPTDAYQPVRDWLADTAAGTDRRVAVLSQTMSGVLDTFKSRVPAMAAHVEAQVVLRAELRRAAETAYERAFAEASTGMKNGTLLRGEVLARWQDCVVDGDLRPRRGGKAAKGGTRKGKRALRGPSRLAALDTSLRSALESSLVSVADRAAEHVDANWRGNPAGAVLLADAAAERARGEFAKQVFESAFGVSGNASVATTEEAAQATALGRSSPDLPLRAARAIAAWQEQLIRLAEAEDARPAGKRIWIDHEALSLLVLLTVLGEDAPGVDLSAAESEGTSIYTEPRRLLTSVFGAVTLAGILAKARADLQHRVRLLLEEEMVRFVEVIEGAGPCDDVAAIRLYQAEYSLEAVR